MDKVGSPRGLIGYMALTDEPLERSGMRPKSVWRHVFRPRTLVYTVLWGGVGIALVVALFLRQPIGVTVAPVRNPTFVTLSDGSIRNTYDMRLRNMQGADSDFTITLKSDAPMQISLEGADGMSVTVPADQTKLQRVYVTAPAGSPAATEDHTELRFWVQDGSGTTRVHADTIFTGPEEKDTE